MGCMPPVTGLLAALLLAVTIATPTLATPDQWARAQEVMAEYDAAEAETLAQLATATDKTTMELELQKLEGAITTAVERLTAIGPAPCFERWYDLQLLRLDMWTHAIRTVRVLTEPITGGAPNYAESNAAYGVAVALRAILPYVAREVECG